MAPLSSANKKAGNDLLSQDLCPSTIGAEELNFCVRDGNRCGLFAIVTSYFNVVKWSAHSKLHNGIFFKARGEVLDLLVLVR